MVFCVKCDNMAVNRYLIIKILIFTVTLSGMFSPWLVHYYDSYTIVNPETNQGEKKFHSTLTLSPLFLSLHEDDVLISFEWFPSYWTLVSASFILMSAITGLLSQKSDLSLYIILLSMFAGVVIFFLSLSGVNLGWKNFLSWGFWLSFLGLMFSSFLSFFEQSQQEIPLLMNNK